MEAHANNVEGKYRVLAELGEGGSAVVYLAVASGPSGFNKLVVLKTLKRNLADDLDLRKMFLQEARLAARLSHPGIVQTYEVIEQAGVPVIIMEYLEGQPLSKVTMRAKERLTLPTRLRIMADAANALHYAHQLTDFDGTPLELVHRDMTPHNVFVTFDGQTKLLDFGIAKLATSRNETEMGVIKGKLRYMPQEQIAGEPVDRRADIYAMGVMLWETATGQYMWDGCSDMTVINCVLNGEVVAPRTIRPELPVELERICLKALSSNRADRYATAAEFETDIEALLEQLGIRVNSRATGKLVSDLFSDVREKTKALVEKQLSKVASLSWEEYEAIEQPLVPLLPADGTVTGSRDGRRAEPTRAKSSRSGLIGGGLVLLGLGGLGGFGVLRATEAKRAVGPIEPPLAHLPETPAGSQPQNPELPSAARITVRVSATPSSARLYIDRELLPGNPFSRLLPADGLQHIIKAEAEGYEPGSAGLVADHDASIAFDLERVKTAAPERPKPRVQASPPRARPVAPSTNCDPPYSVDSSGIKKFKSECL